MITGYVNPFREAVVRLIVRGPGGSEAEIDAVIDTGFSDYLTLSSVFINALALLSGGVMRATLGDGSEVDLNVYIATVIWDSQPLSVTVVEADGGPLVGMSLLYGYRLEMDILDGGSIRISRLLGNP